MSLIDEYLAQDNWRNWDGMLKMLPENKNQTVLDLGCGPGVVSHRLASRCQKVIGIDCDLTFLATARRLCPSNCEFIEGDLAHLPSGELPLVDGIWSSFTAAYFPNFQPV